MNTCWSHIFIALLFICFAGCGPSKYMLKPEGDTVVLKTAQGREFMGELLSLQDSSIYMVTGQEPTKVVRVVLKNIKNIDIEGYANRSWGTSVILFQAIPTVLLTIAAASVNGSNAGGALLIFGLPTLLTYFAFEASTPSPPHMEQPMAIADLEHLCKYARFPQGLDREQFQKLLRRYGQTEISQLK